MRTLSSPALAVLSQQTVPMALLIEMLFPGSPDYFATGGWDLTWSAKTYVGTGTIIKIDALPESAGAPRGAQITLTGVQSDMVALALQDSATVQGVPINLYTAFLDPTNYTVLNACLDWAGRLDTMQLADSDSGESSIVLTAEHIGIDLLRPSPTRWTDIDQLRLFPGDKGLAFIATTAASPIVWPAASFFKAT
jgi:hypothetical protein